jgi:phosphatidylglycerol:prolipoprotein diacylglycerol transferase
MLGSKGGQIHSGNVPPADQQYKLLFSDRPLVLFASLVTLSRRKRFDGEVILAYTFLYAGSRFVLEFFRGDADRGFVFGGLLSTSQFIALILGPAAIALWLVRRQSALDY